MRLWNVNTVVFALQIIFGVLIYGLTENLLYAFLAAFAVATILLLLFPPMTPRSFVVVAAALSAITLICLVAYYPSWSLSVVVGTIAMTISLIAAKMAKRKGAPESLEFLFVVALPAGVGILIGGVILLYKYWQQHQTSVA